jgi:hypothetical protein
MRDAPIYLEKSIVCYVCRVLKTLVVAYKNPVTYNTGFTTDKNYLSGLEL